MLADHRQAGMVDPGLRGKKLRARGADLSPGGIPVEVGLEPGESLKALQKSILAHDPSLESTPPAEHAVAVERSILVAPRAPDG